MLFEYKIMLWQLSHGTFGMPDKKHSENVTWKKVKGLKLLKMEQDDMDKQESYKTYDLDDI